MSIMNLKVEKCYVFKTQQIVHNHYYAVAYDMNARLILQLNVERRCSYYHKKTSFKEPQRNLTTAIAPMATRERKPNLVALASQGS